ncbi:putative phage tail protein [Hydrocarboniphaga effusa]|uniref:putative phage tail protein n=1 Tax=Hydrocarboniphaga effusa TaxID=243629 RepID=UPI003BA90EB7
MALTAEAIATQLRRLLPRGALWEAPVGSVMWAALLATADEVLRIYGRAADLRDESHPGSVTELIGEWETEYALAGDGDLAERRAALVAKYRAVGGQSRQYYIDVVAGLGFVITIEEPKPFYVGTHGCGDPVGEIEWAFTWIVHAPAGADTALIERTLSPIAPAHGRLIVEAA